MKSHFSLFLLMLLLGIADLVYINGVLAPQLVQEITTSHLPKKSIQEASPVDTPAIRKKEKLQQPNTVSKKQIEGVPEVVNAASDTSTPSMAKKGYNESQKPDVVAIPPSKGEHVTEEVSKKSDADSEEEISGKKEIPSTRHLPQIPNILFATEGARLSNNASKILNQVIEVMRANPQVKLLLRGHTDKRGKAEFNERLSQRRAQAVAQFLIDQGIDSSRIRVEGMGGTQPVAFADDPDAWRKNRRVEILWE